MPIGDPVNNPKGYRDTRIQQAADTFEEMVRGERVVLWQDLDASTAVNQLDAAASYLRRCEDHRLLGLALQVEAIREEAESIILARTRGTK